jgi:hypothetical protein
MKRKILNYLKVFCLFFFMIMGIFFILVGLLHLAGMPLTDGWLLLVLFTACLLEYCYYLWIREC